MDRRTGRLKRFAIATITAATFLSGTGAHAGPEDEVRALLLRVEDVFAAGISPTTVFIAWKDTGLLQETGYRIEVSLDEEGPYTTLQELGSCTNIAGNCVALASPNAPPSDPTPRFYRVVPIFAPGPPGGGGIPVLEGAPSEPDPAILGPQAPTNLRCNGNLACLQVASITLTWTDNSDESLFWIMRARGIINPQFGTEPHATVPANVTTYSETIPEFNQTFFYKIVAVREVNIPRTNGTVTLERAFSDSISPDRVKLETPPVPPPADPAGLTAQFIPPSTAQLTWADTATNEDGFFVEWGPDATDFQLQHTALKRDGVGAVTWTDTGIPPDTSRCYRVRAWRIGPAYSGYTNTVCLGSTPVAPSNLAARAVSNTQVDLTWRDNSNAEDSYAIQRCPGVCTNSSAGWVTIGNAPADSTAFSDMNTVALTTYSYRVFASNASGLSAPSNVATVTTLKAPLARPTGLGAIAIGSHEIELTWIDNATNETGFRIEYRNIDGVFETLAHRGQRSGTGTTTYIDADSLPANTQRCYRVRAVLGTVEVSDPSNVACATTLPPLAPNGAPTGLTATGILDRSIELTWIDNATNESSFRIETIRFPNQHCSGQTISGLPWTDIASAPKKTGTGSTALTITGLQPHTAHFFRVIAVNLDGESGASNVAGCIRTLGPPIPTFLDPAENGDVEVTRCKVQLTTPIMEGPDVETNRMRLKILPSVPGGPPYDLITLWLSKDNGPNGRQPDGRVFTQSGQDIWEFHYQFRKGIAYGLLASGFGPPPTEYVGDEARLRDMTVLADCPQSGL
ncbi:MAG TPA: fibronectin type III domain-containing protein [Actinomycetota bacterium]